MKEFINEYEIISGLLETDLICGVDEAGRGPLCGSVSAAAVIMPTGVIIEGMDDSKKLTERKRERLFEVIIEKALAYSIAFVDNNVIDEINILNASLKAMEDAINGLALKPALALIDGNQNRGITTRNVTIIGGDGKSHSIACASVLAKVARDRYMRELDLQYPEYGFLKHKGYGTKAHYEAIEKHGILDIHRKSFLKNVVRWKT